MKAKYLFVAMLATMLGFAAAAQPRIAVLDFNAGAGVMQNDVNGLSAIFNTYFSPAGYVVVERTRVADVLREQNIQVSSMTEEQRVRLGQILNVPVIVIGDVNYAMQQYNVDVRAVNVETGAIIAKDGAEWAQGSSYRGMMKTLAERMSQNIPLVEFTPRPTPAVKVKNTDPTYRPTGGSLRFTVGAIDIIGAIAYDYQITPSFMIGAGTGVGKGVLWHNTHYWNALAMPVYLESDIRTPRYKWSLFINVKIGVDFYLEEYDNSYRPSPLFASFAIGGSYKNLNLGAGVTAHGMGLGVPFTFSLSYNLPFKSIGKGLF